MIFFYISTLEDLEERLILTRIYNDYHKLMGFTAKKLLKDHQLTEDAVQQTFVKLINNVSTIKRLPKDKIKPYIFITLRNTVFDMIDQNKKYYLDDTLDEKAVVNDSIENEVIQKIQTQEIIKQLNKLSENDVIILQLTYLLGLKECQIAKQLDISVSAVKKRRERAKTRLYKNLTEGMRMDHGNE